jgi:hypothetical protein
MWCEAEQNAAMWMREAMLDHMDSSSAGTIREILLLYLNCMQFYKKAVGAFDSANVRHGQL